MLTNVLVLLQCLVLFVLFFVVLMGRKIYAVGLLMGRKFYADISVGQRDGGYIMIEKKCLSKTCLSIV